MTILVAGNGDNSDSNDDDNYDRDDDDRIATSTILTINTSANDEIRCEGCL